MEALVYQPHVQVDLCILWPPSVMQTGSMMQTGSVMQTGKW